MVSLLKKYKPQLQLLLSVAFIATVSVVCFVLTDLFGYKVVALLLLLAVSVLAMLFDIVPVLIAAILSAMVWNYFFIPPLYTFHIDNAEDILLFLMYFAVALVNTVLSFRIKKQEKMVQEKEKKENSIRLYNTLLNSLSHELRTPISTIIGASDILKENAEKLSQVQYNKLLEEIGLAGLRLNGQVENLLNMSRLESGILNLKKDWCNINELIFSIIRKLEELREERKIIFIPNEETPFFKIDEGLIYQALYNIVHNALMYTPPDATIVITATYEEGNCVVQIQDNGNGFPVDEIDLVFDKFYRLNHSKSGGTGLGLSITKGFIQAHEGQIHLSNREGGGAVFEIRLPAETSYINHLKNE